MNIEIRKLTPELLNDYLHFFETEAHADNEDEDRCYCVCWCSADHRAGTDFSSPEKRRALAVQYINDDIIKGYLAYHEGKVVGWCNANEKSKCLHCISWLHFMTQVNDIESSPDEKVKSVYCFTIAPQYKRKGIATQLLKRVCEDAPNEGFSIVEAYPNKEFINVFRDFMGPADMYKRNGFTIFAEFGNIMVVRKVLKHAGALNDAYCAGELKNAYNAGELNDAYYTGELKNFLDKDGRLKSYPAKQRLKTIALFYLASKFEKDKKYLEKEINEILKNWHTFEDWAMLRRDLFDKRFLGRDPKGKEYWLEEKQPTFASFGLEK